MTITTADTKPRPEAVAIGKVLEAEPPFGYRDRFSEWGWAHVAEGVLRAQERVRAQRRKSEAQGELELAEDNNPELARKRNAAGPIPPPDLADGAM